MTCRGRRCYVLSKNIATNRISLMFHPSHVGRMRKIEYFLDLENLTWKNIFQLIFFRKHLIKKSIRKSFPGIPVMRNGIISQILDLSIFSDLREIILVREENLISLHVIWWRHHEIWVVLKFSTRAARVGKPCFRSKISNIIDFLWFFF